MTGPFEMFLDRSPPLHLWAGSLCPANEFIWSRQQRLIWRRNVCRCVAACQDSVSVCLCVPQWHFLASFLNKTQQEGVANIILVSFNGQYPVLTFLVFLTLQTSSQRKMSFSSSLKSRKIKTKLNSLNLKIHNKESGFLESLLHKLKSSWFPILIWL